MPLRRVAGNARIETHPDYVDLVVPMAGRPPYFVDEGTHELTVTLYDTMINTDIVNYGGNDSLHARGEVDAGVERSRTLHAAALVALVRLSRVLAERRIRAARAASAAH